MTANQIAFWNLQELKRSNLAKEAENVRSHRESEYIGWGNLNETRRHNVQDENLEVMKLDETGRHNLATEGETVRSDLAKETETHRHNVVSEGIESAKVSTQMAQIKESARQFDWSYPGYISDVNSRSIQAAASASQAESAALQAEMARVNAQTRREELEERIRHEKVTEIISGVDAGSRTISNIAGVVVPLFK